jgi:hypothetical protein
MHYTTNRQPQDHTSPFTRHTSLHRLHRRITTSIRGRTNKVRELIAVEVLYTSLLKTNVIAFKVLPLGRYEPMPVPSPPFKTILEPVLWNGLQTCHCITPDVMSTKCLPFNISFTFRNRKKTMGTRSGE